MRISTPIILSATLTAVLLPCHQLNAATLTVHTEAPKVNVHVPPPKVNVSAPSPTVQTSSSHVTQHDLHATKTLDKSSAQKFKGIFKGRHIKSGKITARKGSESNTAYDKKSDENPSESMQLNYSHIEIDTK
jgi:type VI protein secretion system component Hcp